VFAHIEAEELGDMGRAFGLARGLAGAGGEGFAKHLAFTREAGVA
jgi:hypothetical protein